MSSVGVDSAKPQVGMIRTVVSGDPEYEDRYAAKLVKYIPAEVLAAFIPLVALADTISSGSRDVWIWLTIGIGAFAVFGYARWHAADVIPKQVAASKGVTVQDVDEDEVQRMTPNWYVYVLSLVAFGAWALATAGPVRRVVGLTGAESEYIVAAVTFLLPLLDATFAHFSRSVADGWKHVVGLEEQKRLAAH